MQCCKPHHNSNQFFNTNKDEVNWQTILKLFQVYFCFCLDLPIMECSRRMKDFRCRSFEDGYWLLLLCQNFVAQSNGSFLYISRNLKHIGKTRIQDVLERSLEADQLWNIHKSFPCGMFNAAVDQFTAGLRKEKLFLDRHVVSFAGNEKG